MKFSLKNTFYIPALIFFLIIIINFILILTLNSFHFTYIIDDSYIHLALAENISKLHYGINNNEFSAPSSSIIWPCLIAPFSVIGVGYYLPFIINLLSSIGILYIFRTLFITIFNNNSPDNIKMNRIVILFLILVIIATNMVGLTYGGMEHSLQTFFALLIVLGIVNEIRTGKIPMWFPAAVIIAPLIRYENLALSFAAIVYIYFAGNKKTALLSFALIVLLIGSFSLFLLNLGLEPLPTSVLNKSSLSAKEGFVISTLTNFKENFFSPRCSLLLIGMLFLFYYTIKNKRNKKERLLSGCIAFSILLHMLFSKDGRYVVYIWTASIFIFLFFYREWLFNAVFNNSFIKTALISSIIVITVSYKYIFGIFVVPIASNNIYEQQYQMHRFAIEFYKKPVAVNDLGYVAYQNNNYVLDLFGLGSLEALNLKRRSNNSGWMDNLAKKHNVKLAMIYDSWFPDIPTNWIKIGELYLGKKKIAPSEEVVSFYYLDQKSKKEIYPLLNEFKKVLPEGVKFVTFAIKFTKHFNPEKKILCRNS
jgi:hypothetical protein